MTDKPNRLQYINRDNRITDHIKLIIPIAFFALVFMIPSNTINNSIRFDDPIMGLIAAFVPLFGITLSVIAGIYTAYILFDIIRSLINYNKD